jgi:sRNA-binding carbon storage regulator CsrA
MLILARKPYERIRIRDLVSGSITWVTLVEVRGDKIRLGFTGCKDIEYMREELLPANEQFPTRGEDRGHAEK